MKMVAEIDQDIDDHDFDYSCECRACRDYLIDLLADQAVQDNLER